MLQKIKKRIFIFMFICFMILYVPCYVLARENDSNNIGLSEDVMVACDKALATIAVMKQDTEIYIGDIFNVINEEGEMEGYSLGFFSDGVPYGYAIYSIEKECVTEFAYNKGVENIYLQLEDLAESKNIDEELLAEGLVYDGVIDYYVIDDEGSTFSSSGEVEELSENETDVIIESFEEYNSSVQSTQDTASIAGTYYGSEVKFDDLPRLGSELYGEIPDCGLAMFGQFYYMDSIHKYCCAVSSAVGCLNWLGILDNGSVTDTYNNIWNRCVSSESIEYDNALNAYTGGASDYNLSRALSAYLSEKGVETKAIYKERPTFNDYIDSINSYNDKESCPATVGIGGYKTEDDKEKYEGHSVIAMSYYCTTYPGQSIYTDYLGIYQNWGAWNGSLENAGENIRYLNYSSLMSESGVIVTGVFFKMYQAGILNR